MQHIKLTAILESVMNEIGENTAQPYDFRVKKEWPGDETQYEWKTDEEGEDPISYTMVIYKWTDNRFSRELNYMVEFGIDVAGLGTKSRVTSKTMRTGNMRRVMATVIAALKQEIARDSKKPGQYVSTIHVSPYREDETDERRAKLYLAYIDRNKPAGSTVSYDSDRGSIKIKLPKPNTNKKESTELNEAFDSPYPTTTTERTDTVEKQEFSTKGEMRYEIVYSTESRGTWEVYFRSLRHDWGSFGVTGTGDQMSVFSTVMASIAEFLKRIKPNKLTFSAWKEDTSRHRLYSTLVKRYKPEGYDITINNRDREVSIFVLKRKK